MPPSTVLVTGCAGFIGSNFVRQFRTRFPDTVVVGIDDFSTGSREDLDRSITFHEGSVTDGQFVRNVFAAHRPDYVFHFAALPRVAYSVEHPTETSFVNIHGTITLLEASRDYGAKRFIFSSTCAVYGTPEHLPTNEESDPPQPASPYGFQKQSGELACRLFSELYHLDTVCFRYFNVFGPGQHGTSAYSTVIAAWLEGLYFPQNKKLFIEGDGTQSRDFVYIDNVVEANLLAMNATQPLNGAIINIGNGRQTDLRTVKQLIETYTGRSLELENRPPRVGDVRHLLADITKAERLIGYRPRVDFETGLKRTIEWFEKRKRT